MRRVVKVFLPLSILLVLFSVSAVSYSANPKNDITFESTKFTYDDVKKEYIFEGDVKAAGKGIILKGDKAVLREKDQQVILKGHASFEQGSTRLAGETIEAYLQKKQATAKGNATLSDKSNKMTSGKIFISMADNFVQADGDVDFSGTGYTLKAAALKAWQGTGKLLATGNAVTNFKGMKLSSDRIEAATNSEELSASGNVVFNSSQFQGAGDALKWFGKEKNYFLLEGNSSVQTNDTFFKADKIEGFENDKKLIATRNVFINYKDINGQADNATYWKDENKMILVGNSVIKKGANTFTGETFTIKDGVIAGTKNKLVFQLGEGK